MYEEKSLNGRLTHLLVLIAHEGCACAKNGC